MDVNDVVRFPKFPIPAPDRPHRLIVIYRDWSHKHGAKADLDGIPVWRGVAIARPALISDIQYKYDR